MAVVRGPVFILVAVLVTPFEDALTNTTSPQFKALEAQVVVMYKFIYRARYGLLFSHVIVIAFRQAGTRTRASNTEAEVEVVFNNTITPAEIPQAADVAKTLVEAVSKPNNFTLTINATSVVATQVNTSTTTTVSTTTSVTTPTNATTTNLTITTSVTNTTTASTTTVNPTTTTTVTTAEPVKILAVKFRSVKGIFTTELLTSSSTAFKQRATLIRTALEPFYQERFPSFRFITVTAFSNGSIVNDMDIGFALSLVPNANEIAQVLIDAAKITPFDIETSSIFVNGTLSHGVSHKISLLTASCMVLLSWLLSGQQ
nr:cell wall integrity and stress response component 4 [Maylandia zebra]